jgi:hypothetical protein
LFGIGINSFWFCFGFCCCLVAFSLSGAYSPTYEINKSNKRDSPGKLMRDSDGKDHYNSNNNNSGGGGRRTGGDGYRNSPNQSHSSSNLLSSSPSKYNNTNSNYSSRDRDHHFTFGTSDSLSSSPGDEDERNETNIDGSGSGKKSNDGRKGERLSGERAMSIDKTIPIALTVSPRGRHVRQGSGGTDGGGGKLGASRSEGDGTHL